jgi:hypothetical protein
VNYTKCAVAGLLAVIGVFVVLPLVVLVVITVMVVLAGVLSSAIAGMGFDPPRWHVPTSPIYWLVVIAVFGAGFFWQFRRLSRKPR